MKSVFLLFSGLALAVGMNVVDKSKSLSGQEFVDYINNNQNLWTARLNTIPASLGRIKPLPDSKKPRNLAESRLLDIDPPKHFDPRDKWPMCKSLWHIRDQSSCGTSKGEIQVSLSVNDLLSCCHDCGHGCNGGDEAEAYAFYEQQGIVTGSDYTEHQGCMPYPLPMCEHHNNHTTYPACHDPEYQTPKCQPSCQKGYNKSYEQDKYFGLPSYDIDNDVEAIQKELITNGPITVGFDVYKDFEQYTGGIYKHVAGENKGGHSVKMMGWGEENGTPYWLVAIAGMPIGEKKAFSAS
uniref:Peptidase C1A papain C-terminal domain-containing protein n=1 Tax=Ditylenchus dipsaci TaxID=166011 RepID=A0A915EFT0_9BILA